MSTNFIHLNCHSEYSLVDGLLRIKPWLTQAASQGMPAIALTDHTNLFGMVKFYKESLTLGIKPIIGCDVWIENELHPNQPSKLLLLCQNQTGYINLTNLISQSYINGQQNGIPIIKKTSVRNLNAGLLALAPLRNSDIAHYLHAGEEKLAKVMLKYWLELFRDRFYLCVTRTNRKGEHEAIQQTIKIATSTSCPIVATNEVCFLAREDFEAHDARVCVNQGLTLNDPTRPRNYSEEQYLKNPTEMAALFADLPEALANTVEIAKRCNVMLTLGKIFLPKYPVPTNLTAEQMLSKEAHAGLEQRFLRILQNCSTSQIAEKREQYNQRLMRELDVINNMGFASYFLIVADFIKWAHSHNIPVGPGRGSGAGSIVAYALEITALDPIEYDLLFERFLNPERVSMPDFDIDFCMEGRDKVIDYVHSKYGKTAVSQIITFGTMAAKAVIRDVGRVLGHPYGFVDQIAKLIPLELGITLSKALQQEETLATRYKNEEDVKNLLDLAQKLEGITRNVGVHAGGVVIAPSDLTNYTPLYCEQGAGQVITQFDMNDLAAIGLIKFDFLGLRTLTIIDWTLQTVNAQRMAKGEAAIALDAIPLNDPKPFELLLAGHATAIFQLESRGAKDLIKRIPPTCLNDIVALVALNRPGPLQSGMVEDFINRKKGLAIIKHLHPKLEPILQPTYGVILYQEQVMQIAQELAGYTLGAADILRSAMGKKKPKEMAKQRKIFIQGAMGRGVDKELAEYIFNLMEKFAGYGFNKSHSSAYALITYHTAWLKAHFPAAFMAAVMSADLSNTDKIVLFINECKELKLPIIAPSVTQSMYKFTATLDSEIIYGLGAIKGLGEGAIATIIAARQDKPFVDLFDFCCRIDLRKVNRRALEALISAGALDCFAMSRSALLGNLDLAMHAALQLHKNIAAGQDDLFGSSIAADDLTTDLNLATFPVWPERLRLAKEKAVLGLYLSGHPITEFAAELHKIGICQIVDLRPLANKSIKIAGFILDIRTRPTKRGDRMAFVTIDDSTGQQEVLVFADLLQKHKELLKPDNFIIVEGTVSEDNFSGGCRFAAKELLTLEQLRSTFSAAIEIIINAADDAEPNSVAQIKQVLQKHQAGDCPVILRYRIANIEAKIRLGQEWFFYPSGDLMQELQQLQPNISVAISYID